MNWFWLAVGLIGSVLAAENANKSRNWPTALMWVVFAAASTATAARAVVRMGWV